ncbi:transposase (plasmid) [Bradyrhizobium japonicum USDA 123]|nr:transposase [Bradyrhizobium japonicum USDA 123]
MDGFSGRFLQCDAYEGYGPDRSRSTARAMEARALLESLRRRFFKLARNSKSPIAEAAVRHIEQLSAIEAMVRGSSPDIRLVARKEHSLLMVAALVRETAVNDLQRFDVLLLQLPQQPGYAVRLQAVFNLVNESHRRLCSGVILQRGGE